MNCSSSVSSVFYVPRCHLTLDFIPPQTSTRTTSASKISFKVSSKSSPKSSPLPFTRGRRRVTLGSTALSVIIFSNSTVSTCWSKPDFVELPNSGGVKVLDLRIGDGQVAIHYYGRLAAKQGWRFDSTYDHKDETGEPIPFIFLLGSGKVSMMDMAICPKSQGMVSTMDSATLPSKHRGIEAAVRSMKVGSIRRVIIPPSQGYQNTSQEPIPPNFHMNKITAERMPDFLALLIWDPAYAYFLAQGAFAKPNRALSPNQFGSAFCGSGSKSDTSSIGCFSHLSITKSRALFHEITSYMLIAKASAFVQLFDRQRLFTTIFNPTRLANGEGSTLGTVIFDIDTVELCEDELCLLFKYTIGVQLINRSAKGKVSEKHCECLRGLGFSPNRDCSKLKFKRATKRSAQQRVDEQPKSTVAVDTGSGGV
ncbi:hypothetical protein RHSIM_Rhsim02G0169200 [Rhododendron simsii]|uniref:peptidylprolyl isomerase n=1 Tax=Rhododendron simsii TaxID=118357 RepID=A0A834HCC1_RHOSS|nr:hypothetical protein RHSIM_Rhsim02G0169200 [Rhododendron simsii]